SGSPVCRKEGRRQRRRRPSRPSLRNDSTALRRLQEERTVLPDDQLLALRKPSVRGTDCRIAADEAVHDLVARLDDRLADHDGRLDVRADEPRRVPDGRVWPGIGLGADDAVLPDYDGTANHAPGLDDGARPDPDAPLDPSPCLDRPLDLPLDVFQEEMVRLEDVFRLARVLPPAR